jgi:hypothetical protein
MSRRRGTNGTRLSWSGVFGSGYRVERSLVLPSASWQPIGAVGGKPAGVPTEFTYPTPAGLPECFYRIRPAL